MNRYRYYNSTTALKEEVLSDVAPTECLTNTDTFVADSLSCVESGILVNDGTSVHQQATLGAYKQLRYNEIDGKTGALIAAGFTYDSQTFSLSANAQANWNNIKVNESEFTFPLAISTKTNDEYSLAQANVGAFWTAGKDAVKGHLDSGRSLKKSVFDAVDRAAVDAIVDNR